MTNTETNSSDVVVPVIGARELTINGITIGSTELPHVRAAIGYVAGVFLIVLVGHDRSGAEQRQTCTVTEQGPYNVDWAIDHATKLVAERVELERERR